MEVCANADKTAELLSKVLDQDRCTAALLSSEVHKDIALTDVAVDSKNIPTDFEINITDVGIWIDPIGNSIINTLVNLGLDIQ